MPTTPMNPVDNLQEIYEDILRFMSTSSTSQAPQDAPDESPRPDSPSPAPLPESDVIQMSARATALSHTNDTVGLLTPLESELVSMVLKLSDAVKPDTDQVLRQADTISALMQQRDLLLRQAEEQRLRWDAEKDGWARMAEAMLAQQAKIRRNSERDEDYERLHAAETDNKGLRQRLHETQSRLQVLESELTRLRPLLMMQPLISRSSMPLATPNPKVRRRKKDAVATEDEGHGPSEDEPLTDLFDTPSLASHSQATPKAKSRKSEAPSNTHPQTDSRKRRLSQKAPLRGLSADARVEHLLLAARKVGKHRAGIMSGMVQQLEEREQERKREESAMTVVAATPKTPKRHASHAYPPESGYIYMNGQMRLGPGMQPVPLFIPAYSHHHLLQTPSSSTTAPSASSSVEKSKQDAKSNHPPTPLDSLLSAARSMMHEDIDVDEDEEVDVMGDSPGNTARTRNTRFRDTFGSPIPKRRKLASRMDKLSASHDLTSRATNNTSISSEVTIGGPGRVRSALDVLADQAAAFSTQDSSVASSQKGKERADAQPDDSSLTPKPRGGSNAESREPEDTPSSVAPTPRSRTPRSDVGDNVIGSISTTAADGSTSKMPVDPGGRTSNTSATDPFSSTTRGPTPISGKDQIAVNNNAQSPRSQATSSHTDDDVTPRQGSHTQVMAQDGISVASAQSNPVPLSTVSMGPENNCREVSPQHHPGTTLSGGESCGNSGSGVAASTASARNKGLIRVAEQDVAAPTPPAKRQRSPYVKWSKEEDDLLAQAVAKYGQKWDLVQKALPSRGYHQVRQRWLRKLGVFDSKPDLSSFQTAVTAFPSTSRGEGVEPRGNLKLGLAPLSSERALSGLVRKSPSMPS